MNALATGEGKEKPYILRKAKLDNQKKNTNLLLTVGDNKRHYVTIKNLSQLLTSSNSSNGHQQHFLECYMDWFLSLICKNYIFKHFVKTVEPTSLKFCTVIELISLHLEYTIAQVKYANFPNVHVQTFVLLNGEMATVSTGFRKLKFWLWLLRTVFYLNQTNF